MEPKPRSSPLPASGPTPPAGEADSDISQARVVAGLVALLVVVAVLRAVPLLAHDWPLRDGGLFYAMIGDLLAAGFSLPDSTSFEGGIIPFAYPPVGFYLAAAVEGPSGVERADILRVLPAIMTVATVAAMYPLAAELAPTRRHALLATTFFAALLGLTDVLIAGGGLTRALGVLLAVLATWQGIRMYRQPRWWYVASTAILSGLAVASHPQTGPFMAVALASAWLTRWRSLRTLMATVAAVVGAVVVASPWLVTVASRHGLDPFLSALRVPDRAVFDAVIAYAFLFLLASPVVGILDILGQVQQAFARRPHLLVWRIGVFVLDMRFSPIAGAAPASLLAAHGTLDALVPAVTRLVERVRPAPISAERREAVRTAVASVVVVLAFVPVVGAAIDGTGAHAALSTSQREAMTWIRDNTTPRTRTVALATHRWGSDIVNEWFPALSLRRSMATSQGLEWAGDIRADQLAAEEELRACQEAAVDLPACIADWVRDHPGTDDLVLYVDHSAATRAEVDALGTALTEDYGYRRLWEGADGFILEAPAS